MGGEPRGPSAWHSPERLATFAQLAVAVLAVIYGAEVLFAAVVSWRLDVQTSELLGDHLEILARAASVVFAFVVLSAISLLAYDAAEPAARRWAGLPGRSAPQPSSSPAPSRTQASAGLAGLLVGLLVALSVAFGAAGQKVDEILDDPDLSRQLTTEQRLLLFLLPREPRRVCVIPIASEQDLPAYELAWLLNTRDGVHVLYVAGFTLRVNSQNVNLSSFNTDGSPCRRPPIVFGVRPAND